MQGNWVITAILQDCKNFATCRISQVVKLPPAHCSPFMPLFMLLFDFLNFCSSFWFLPNLPFMYNGYLRCFFCNFSHSEHYLSSEKLLYRGSYFFGSLINWAGTFQQFPLFLQFLSSSLIFSQFLSLFGQPNTLRG